MAKFTVNAQRYDPYRNFKFKIKIDNQYVAGLNKCSALKKTTEMVEWREGGDPSTTHKLPGKTKYDAITLTGGVTHDTTFEDWANLVNNFKGDAAMSLKRFRKDITIDVFNEAGQLALSYNIFRCWVSEFQALPELDASANAVMIQTVKLENEGWERDTSVTEPTET
jgi:phage tail-like protein